MIIYLHVLFRFHALKRTFYLTGSPGANGGVLATELRPAARPAPPQAMMQFRCRLALGMVQKTDLQGTALKAPSSHMLSSSENPSMRLATNRAWQRIGQEL